MSDKLHHLELSHNADKVKAKSLVSINEIEHFTLPGPALNPKLNIKAIDPKTNEFLSKAKIHNKSNKIFKVSLGLLIVGLIFFLVAGVNLYAQAKTATQNKSIQDCKNIIISAKESGIVLDPVKCEAATGWSNLVGEDKSLLAFNSVKSEISSKKGEIQTKINTTTDSIASLKVKLTMLNQNLDEINANIERNDNLFLYFENLQKQENELNNLLNKNIPKIQTKLLEAKDVLSKVSIIDKEDKEFINKFNSLSQDKQIEEYQKLVLITNRLQLILESINKKSVYPIVGNLSDYKFFSPVEFQALYELTVYSNVQEAQPVVGITGNLDSDNYIRAIAEKRGYKKRVQAITENLSTVDGFKLQSKAVEDWKSLKAAALKDGVSLGLVSGFRGYEDQRIIFTQGLQEQGIKQFGRNYTNEEILSGIASEGINSVLISRSIPGYSKHHTGYTIDITDSSSNKTFTRFDETAGYKWISENNFYNAKRFGFIPSYPKGGSNFGPNPESWEYVWVGRDVLKQ
jgi:D-alanyl-D-alanine carboxypeptidase